MTATPVPVRAECKDCGLVWTLTTLPVLEREFVRLAKAARCPRCGAPSRRHYIYEPWREPRPTATVTPSVCTRCAGWCANNEIGFSEHRCSCGCHSPSREARG